MEKKKRISLIKVFLLKEKIHYKRIAKAFIKLDGWLTKILGGVLIAIFITFFHYIYATPHFIFECILYVFYRDQYSLNMKNLYNKAIESLEKEKGNIQVNVTKVDN